MVGDRLNTDILFGKNGNLSTLLVLTGERSFWRWILLSPLIYCWVYAGITHEEDISGPNASPIVPDFVTNSIGDLRALRKAN